jgi:hypothetical protein
MVCEEELTPCCQQSDHEPHLVRSNEPGATSQSHWFVQWCLQMIGADEEAVRERYQTPWVVLLCLGPIRWLRLIVLVCSILVPGKRPTTKLSKQKVF